MSRARRLMPALRSGCARLLPIVLGGLAAVSGCEKPFDNGYAVDLIVSSDGTIGEAELKTTRTLDFTVTGAEMTTASYQLSRPFDGGEERVIYRPAATGGDLSFLVVARDMNGARLASGTDIVTLEPGKTVTRSLKIGRGSTDGGGGGTGLVIDRSSFDFGTFVTGQSPQPTTFTITNAGSVATGTLASALSGVGAASYSIEADTCAAKALPAGASCTLAVRLLTTTVGTPVASLMVSADPPGSATAALSATVVAPGTLSISPTTSDFGSIARGQSSAELSFEVRNNGGSASGPLTVTLSGNDAPIFSTPVGCAQMALNAGAACTITIKLTPGATTPLGMKSATLKVEGMPGGIAPAELRGSVIAPGALGITPGFQDFGKVNIGQMSAVKTYAITNTGQQASGALSTMKAGDVAQFAVVTDQCDKQVLAAGASCMLGVRFQPTSAMVATLVLTVSGMPGGAVPATAIGQGGDFVTLTVTKGGGGAVAAPGITCGVDCTELYPRNAMVVVNALPDLTSRFGTWSGGACAGSKLGVCTVTMDADKTLTAAFVARPAQNLMFTSSSTVVPKDLGAGGVDPLVAADNVCKNAALRGGLSGTFKAFLSTSAVSAMSRLGAASGWLRPDGLIFAASQVALSQGKILYVPRVDETGTLLADDPNITTGSNLVVTGTDQTGASFAGRNCGDYKQATTVEGGIASTGTEVWVALGEIPCAQASHLYCFETSYNTGIAIPSPGVVRRAFVTESTQVLPVASVAAADLLCDTEGDAIFGASSYKALIAPAGATAASRFNIAGGTAPWARPDNILLSPTAAGLFMDSISAAFNVTSGGNYVGFAEATTPRVAVGSASGIGSTGGANCTGWTAATGNTSSGRATFADLRWAFGVSSDCAGDGVANNKVRFYCLQE